MEVIHSVHWLRYSVPSTDFKAACGPLEARIGQFDQPIGRGGFNQPSRSCHDSGVAIYHGSSYDDQPIVVDCPGEACERLGHEVLAESCVETGGRVSRLDVAADVLPESSATPRLIEMRDLFRKGICTTLVRSGCQWHESDGVGEGRTLYIGSRASECFMRAYDKRGPLRIEYELKPKDKTLRRFIASSLVKQGPASLWRGAAQLCVFEVEWFKKLMSGDAVEIQRRAASRSEIEESILFLGSTWAAYLQACVDSGVSVPEIIHVITGEKPQLNKRAKLKCDKIKAFIRKDILPKISRKSEVL